MARKSITQDLHGTKWKVHQDLADSPGLRFAQEYFSGYDWSRVMIQIPAAPIRLLGQRARDLPCQRSLRFLLRLYPAR
jgi:hypothetical protein